ncbi:unnamed protein product, partial [marine sediment metagenome]
TYAERLSETTLAFTGIKSIESGPVRIAIFWLTGDIRARDLVRQADQVMVPSEPYNITIAEKRSSLRQVLNSRLIQSGIAIMHAQLNDAVMTEVNTLDNSLVQGFINPLIGLQPFAPGGDSHLDFIKENDQLYLSVKVSTV